MSLTLSCSKKKPETISENRINIFPTRTSKNTILNFKDSGRLVVLLRSPLIEEFEAVDSPFSLFPIGVDIDFYEKNQEKPGNLRADSAKHESLRKFYSAYGNVVLKNAENDSLLTDTLFWDQVEKRIFTKDTVRIYRSDGSTLTASYGLEASEDFKEYTLYQNRGNFLMENSEL